MAEISQNLSNSKEFSKCLSNPKIDFRKKICLIKSKLKSNYVLDDSKSIELQKNLSKKKNYNYPKIKKIKKIIIKHNNNQKIELPKKNFPKVPFIPRLIFRENEELRSKFNSLILSSPKRQNFQDKSELNIKKETKLPIINIDNGNKTPINFLRICNSSKRFNKSVFRNSFKDKKKNDSKNNVLRRLFGNVTILNNINDDCNIINKIDNKCYYIDFISNMEEIFKEHPGNYLDDENNE